MDIISRVTEIVGKTIYFIVALSLMLISLSMMGVAIYDVWVEFHQQTRLVAALLDAIGFIVIAMAVFDVSKFLLEEEVFKNRRLGAPQEAHVTLTKFLVIVSIAVSLEALVFIFDAAKKDITTLVYPTFLLIAVVALVIGLGIFQRLSFNTELDKNQKAAAKD